MNFRDRLEQSRERQGSYSGAIINAELENEFYCDYFATDNIKSLPACLDIRLPDGCRKAVPYSGFMGIELDVDNGIEILTSTKKVKILGRDLEKLYDYLVAYRVRFVTANKGSDLNDEGLFVREILIEDLP